MAVKWFRCVSSILKEIEEFSPPVPVASVKDFSKAADAFDKKNRFPVSTTRCKNLKLSDEELLNNINGCYPLIHEDVLRLSCAFLTMKRSHGTSKEKELYARINLLDFFDRLLSKRPLVFMNSSDSYRLKDTKIRGSGGFDLIGTEAESPPLIIEDLMTYDEIKLAALVNFSGPTAIINAGGRHNGGIKFDGNKPFEPNAVYVGLVGARFERSEVMESQEILIQSDRNVLENGYGLNMDSLMKDKEPTSCLELMAQLYDQSYGFPSNDDVVSNDYIAEKMAKGDIRRIESYERSRLFNAEVFKKRIHLSVFPFLAEANARAKAASKRAYVHVVGLGLGVWKVFQDQNALFVEVFAGILTSTSFDAISDVDFSYLHVDKCGETGNCQIFPGTDIKMHFSRREPFAKLEGDDDGKLVVASWAYDGNSFIGNEYWDGSLTASGDPAAACCSQISELLNPCINRMISGTNMHVAMGNGSVVSLRNYVDNLDF